MKAIKKANQQTKLNVAIVNEDKPVYMIRKSIT